MFENSRRIEAPKEFAASANMNTEKLGNLYAAASRSHEDFWADLARTHLTWKKPFTNTLDWKPPFAKWFTDGELNASEQCLDRHLSTRANKNAIVWEGEQTGSDGKPTHRRVFTYAQLHREVGELANALEELGVKKGDRVAIYLPMIVEAAVAMLACARLGATHSVVFGGFASEALSDRINDADAHFVITANAGFRRGKPIYLKKAVDDALTRCPNVRKVVVVDRLGETGNGPYSKKVEGTFEKTDFTIPRDIWYHEIMVGQKIREATAVNAEHPLFILYTSGTTGKPKGVVHSTAGFVLWTKVTYEWIFDFKENDIFWCTADVGWVTGHSYVVYGPLAAGSTSFMYEGAPDSPNLTRFWDIIEREKVTVFYTAPTAIRTFMRSGRELPDSKNLKSLRLLGSVGEPINPEAWEWYAEVIGGSRCPVVDTWWQTETGGIMISVIPGLGFQKPGCATKPLPGIDAAVVDENGTVCPTHSQGRLVIKKPWPGQLRTLHNDPDRYVSNYWSSYNGPGGKKDEPYYFAGDAAFIDKDGDVWILGRMDDVINVAGHRIGTMELESALISHKKIAESAVVGIPDDLKGTSIYAFVTVRKNFRDELSDKKKKHELVNELKTVVAAQIGSFAKPDHFRFTDALPKTRSGKIMRRLLRDIASGKDKIGDTTTLEDLSVLSTLKEYQDE